MTTIGQKVRPFISWARPVIIHKRQLSSAATLTQPALSYKPIVSVIPGDGVSPELLNTVQEVFKETGIPVDFEEHYLSEIHPKRSEKLEDVIDKIRKNNGVCIKGVIQSSKISKRDSELMSLNMRLRRELDLFANVVHIKSFEGVKTRHSGLDFVIIREQTEGEYSALEHESVPGVVESLKIMTRPKCTRIAKFAFDYATRHGRKKVTAVHKANIMKLGDGLFLRCCDEVSKLYPHIQFENIIIDNCCMQLVYKPQQFDVMVMPNLYGNIVDNLAAGLVGGAGLVTGESVGADCVVFEQGARHSFQDAIGRQIANPTALLLCASNLLNHLHMKNEARLLRQTVERTINEGKVKTRDLGGYATTTDFAMEIIRNYERLAHNR